MKKLSLKQLAEGTGGEGFTGKKPKWTPDPEILAALERSSRAYQGLPMEGGFHRAGTNGSAVEEPLPSISLDGVTVGSEADPAIARQEELLRNVPMEGGMMRAAVRGMSAGDAIVPPPREVNPGVPTGDIQSGIPEDAAVRKRIMSLSEMLGESKHPDISLVPGLTLTPEASDAVRPILDATTGFNGALADLAGLPVEAVDMVMKQMGSAGFLDNPGDAIQAIKDAAGSIGLSADVSKASSKLAAKIGNEAFQSMTLLAVLFGFAPSMVSNTLNGMRGAVMKDIGSELIRRPGTAVATDMGSVVGANLAENEAKSQGASPAVQQAAELAGSLFGGGLINSVVAGGRRAIKSAVQGLKPIMTEVSPLQARQFAQEAVAGDLAKVDSSIKATIESVKVAADPLLAAERLRNGLTKAYKQARQVEEGLWSKVNLKRSVPAVPLKEFAIQMAKGMSRMAPDQTTAQYLGRIMRFKGNPTLADLKALRSEIMTATRGDLGRQMTDETRANLNALSEEILGQMERAFPGDKALQTAREYGLWLHNRFSRGPVGQFLGRPGAGIRVDEVLGDLMDPERAAQTMVRRSKSGPTIKDISDNLDMDGLIEQSRDYIASRFREEAAAMDARAAGSGQKFLNSPENKRFLEAFPKADAEMKVVSQKLGEALETRQSIENSAFKRFGDEDIQTAVTRLFTSGNKVQSAREIRKRLSEDPSGEALRGLKNGVMDYLLTTKQGSPTRIRDMLTLKDNRQVLSEILGQEEFTRVNKLINDAALIEQGHETVGKKYTRKGLTMLARIIGARTGAAIGGGTIQSAGMVSNAARGMMENIFRVVDPEVMLARALKDPKWEGIIRARVPENIPEARRFIRQVRRLVITTETLNQLGD